MYRHITAPLYVKQDEFDTSPLNNLKFDWCSIKYTQENTTGEDYIRRFGASARKTLEQYKGGDGVYLASCFNHGGHKAIVNSDRGGTIDYEQSMGKWFHGLGAVEDYRLMDKCTEEQDGLPCNDECDDIDVDCCPSTFNTACIDWIEQ